MRKIKIILMSAAVIIACGSTLAKKAYPLCEDYPQYYKYGSTFRPAGEYGVDYFCWSGAGTCTYYQPSPGVFVPCRDGSFEPLFANKSSRLSGSSR